MKNILLFLCIVSYCSAQELQRRAFLGIRMSAVNDDTRRLKKLPEVKGVLLEEVLPQSTAERAGFKKGDVLLRINDTEVNTPQQGVSLVGGLPTGSDFTYELFRDGKSKKGKARIEAMPYEKHEGIQMQYGAVQTVNGLQRIIVSRLPGNEKRPVIVFIGGIGCYSLDAPLETDRSEVRLLNDLTRAGYVCVRAEKPGVGDNRACTPCEKVSFTEEAAGYTAIVAHMKKQNYADSSQIYIFGHSMGGVMAPLVAKQQKLAGIVAYGTLGSNFIEYLAKTRRTLAAAYEMPPDETDAYIKDYCECAVWYFADSLSTEQAAKKNPDCREYLSIFDLRSRAYMHELYSLNIAGSWKYFNGKALLLYGQQDFIASEEDHRIVAESLNFYHPGAASFVVVKDATHGMTHASSFQQALKDEGKYSTEVSKAVLDWLRG